MLHTEIQSCVVSSSVCTRTRCHRSRLTPRCQNRSDLQINEPVGRRGVMLALGLAAARPLCWQANAQEVVGKGLTDLPGLKNPEKAASTCPTGDEGIECKRRIIQEDKMQAYPSPGSKSLQAVSGVPVAEMKDDYTKATYALTEALQKYITLDPYDKERFEVIKSIKENARQWAGKYAPGGSARKLSARKFYIAVDAVNGHLVAYGLSPYPKNRVPKIQDSIDQTRALLQQNK
ncbi:hypothetical protein WJX84_001454 [Apatococcus fuscideae]|uniref:Uncharacterized protein n=1 Tax=Apatococcus fuscideae TaxID=2026836 RepID=A0AAW1RNF0_9CHLO